MTTRNKQTNNPGPSTTNKPTSSSDYQLADYSVTEEAKIKIHHEALKLRVNEENERLTLIESKTSQMVSQTSLIFALLGLFVPTFVDKIGDQSSAIRIAFFILLFLAFIFYLLTIQIAAKNLNVKNFFYARPNPTNVIKYQDKSVTDFLAIEIRDLFYSAGFNAETNNRKASNLVRSSACFRIANGFTAILGLLLCFLLLFSTAKKNAVTIENPVRIENVDSRSENK